MMMRHQYNIGQMVRVRNRFPDRSGEGLYEVVRLLPATPNGDLHYRIKSNTGQERAVTETELTGVS